MNLYDNNLNKNNQNNNEQFYKIYNDSFKQTKYKKRPSALIVVLIIIVTFIGIRFLIQFLSIGFSLFNK